MYLISRRLLRNLLNRRTPEIGPTVIVCHCRVVTDRAVADAVRAGARSVSSACRATGAGQDCGSCIFSVKRLVCEHGNELVPSGTGPAAILTEGALMEEQSAAS